MSESLPVPAPTEPTEARETELWQVLDWSLWGNGLGDVLREAMADTMVAAITAEQRDTAEACIKAWHERRGPSMAVGEGLELQRQRDALRVAYVQLHEVVRAFLAGERNARYLRRMHAEIETELTKGDSRG